MPDWRAAAMEILADAAVQRESLRCRGRAVRWVGVEDDLAIERRHQSVQQHQRIGSRGRAHAVGEVDDGGVRRGQCGLA
jgi:hypothetical protein